MWSLNMECQQVGPGFISKCKHAQEFGLRYFCRNLIHPIPSLSQDLTLSSSFRFLIYVYRKIPDPIFFYPSHFFPQPPILFTLSGIGFSLAPLSEDVDQCSSYMGFLAFIRLSFSAVHPSPRRPLQPILRTS